MEKEVKEEEERLCSQSNTTPLFREEVDEEEISRMISHWAGIKDPRRPIGSFIFLGHTGVGMTDGSMITIDSDGENLDLSWKKDSRR